MSRLGEVAAGGRRIQDGQLQFFVGSDDEHCARGQGQASLVLLVRVQAAVPAQQNRGLLERDRGLVEKDDKPLKSGT
jgi:hypothetical protein